MSKVLFIDAVTSLGSGHLQLQRELALSAANSAPNGWKVALLQADHVSPVEPSDTLKVFKYPHPGPGWIKRWQWFNNTLPTIAQNHNAAVFFSLNGILSKNLISQFACIGTVNNMVPFTPLLAKRQSIFSKDRLRTQILKHQYTWSLKNAHSVLVHSKFALDQTEKWTGSLKNKSVVCHTGMPTNLSFDPKHTHHPLDKKPYLLYVSALQWYKNHENLLLAYKKLFMGDKIPPALVLAGPIHDKSYATKIVELTKTLGLSKYVLFAGSIPRSELGSWMNHAEINIFASLCETNSVILAETLGVGAVLLTSNREPMPEISGDAAEYFDPEDISDIARKIQNLLNDPEKLTQLREKAVMKSKEFSWEKCGCAIWESAEISQRNFRSNS